MEQVTSQTSVSRELRSWVEEKAHSRLKHGGPEHWECPHQAWESFWGTRKSLNKPYTMWGSGSKHTSCTGQQGLRIQQGWAGQDEIAWRDSMPGVLSQPRSIWNRSLLTEWKFWLHMAPSDLRSSLVNSRKALSSEISLFSDSAMAEVRSHPAITTLVLRRLFILFHLGLVAHAHWSWGGASSLLIPPPPFLTVRCLVAFVGGNCIRQQGWGWGGEETWERFWVMSSSPGIKKWMRGRRHKWLFASKSVGPSWVPLLSGLPFIRTVLQSC